MPGLERRVGDLFSAEALHHARYIPRIARRVRNWPRFLATYMRLTDRPGIYHLRRGNTTIRARSGIDVSTIAVVFIKEDYGPSIGGGTVVDIGANIGVFSLFAAAEPGTRVFAYEPVGETYRQLRENVELNAMNGRVTTFNVGVSGASERRAIHLSPHGSPFSSLYGSDGDATEEIACIGLERVFEENAIERCDLLKLDCEGAEFEILFGAPDDVLARVRRICVEYHEQAVQPRFRRDTLIDYLQARGFRVTHETGEQPNCGTLWLARAAASG